MFSTKNDEFSPCQIKFDYVLHYESMDADSNYLLQDILHSKIKLKGTQDILWGEKNSIYDGNPTAGLNHFCIFEDSIIERIEKFYLNDYKLFGYKQFDRETYCQ